MSWKAAVLVSNGAKLPALQARIPETVPRPTKLAGLDIGHEYVRGAIADLSGEIRARSSVRGATP